MTDLLASFVNAVMGFCMLVMHGLGAVNAVLTSVLNDGGIDPQRQLYILLVTSVFLVVLALRVIGGFVGWLVMIAVVLLMLDRLAPVATLHDHVVPPSLQNAL